MLTTMLFVEVFSSESMTMRQSMCSKNPIVGPGTVSTKDCHFVAVPLG